MSDDFRPRAKFPIDPFAAIPHSAREPWTLHPERLAARARDVLLVLGVTPATNLAPLLHSPQLSSGLLLLVSHEPLALPAHPHPAVRVLRLAAPLALENAGSVRLVGVLEWAARIARLWRRRPAHGVLELAEGSTDPAPTPRSALPSPRASATNLVPLPLPPSRSSSPKPPPADPSPRAFDALVNFLPPHLPDKALLKHAILVTTLSRTFLAAPPARRRSSLFARAGPVHALPPGPPDAGAPLVHVLPAASGDARPKLVHGIESFLLSFCVPAAMRPPARERTLPYLLDARAFAAALPHDAAYTVADALLSGALDGGAPRAWVAGPADVVLAASPSSHSVPSRPCPYSESLSMPAMSRARASSSNPGLCASCSSAESSPPATPRADSAASLPAVLERAAGSGSGSGLKSTPGEEAGEGEGEREVRRKRSRWRFWRGGVAVR
ncbi:hypothetical protein GLOTRDRAFT_134237 [Gloeophyllum trabeum ATCC 11539]|uniref:Uncharacterized protein n=1 Tax=Gloeophyllum trabeum (strain ATCC 11539 / FP-39264 / Madison 617) TaxID=670483 RepID=S7PRX1_GLOTA|nr:uncharacterized protein GLOTRDRAFT_134237 [Gloeophyllum trabeum ATCC 11539]EPQ50122.1 hypothetical protein GLOTRDRAFT_134237 [Gloeophyllum trabeum ATCC 11539]